MNSVKPLRRAAVYFRHENRFGEWALKPGPRGTWEIWHDGYAVERHPNLAVAFSELITGGCYWPDGLDPSECDLPDDLSEWEAVRFTHR